MKKEIRLQSWNNVKGFFFRCGSESNLFYIALKGED